MSIIKCNNLSLGYEGNPVINNLTFNVDKNDYICIIGENGSGKSTLIKALLGLKTASEGQITFKNIKRDEVGYLPQQSEIQQDFPASTYEVIISGRLNSKRFKPFYNKTDRQIVEDRIKILDIEDIRNYRFADLSGGQKQRVLIARALCSTKKVLILDEPTSGLDPMIANEVYTLLNKINKEENIAIIMVTHDVENAMIYSNKILYVNTTQPTLWDTDNFAHSDIGKSYMKGHKI